MTLFFLPVFVLLECSVTLTTAHQAISLSLGIKSLANNSEIAITDIGEFTAGTSSLVCTTTFAPCCSRPSVNSYSSGQWYYPNGTMVLDSAAGGGFYGARGDRTVSMSRRNNVTSPLGIFCCDLPVTSSDLQTLCVTVVEPPSTSTSDTSLKNEVEVMMEDDTQLPMSAPTFVIKPYGAIVTELDSTTFMCNATGVPRPNVTWVFNASNDSLLTQLPLSSLNGKLVISRIVIGNQDIGSTLTVVEALPSDAGNYTCIAMNEGGTITYTAALKVYVSSRITSTYADMKYTVNEMDRVTFECTATGIPPPAIYWFRYNGVEVVNSMTDLHITVGDGVETYFTRHSDGETISSVTCSLNFINTTDDDSGMYICVAINNAIPGSDMMDFELIVQTAPVITQLAPQQIITAPNMANISCEATGKPRPTFTWYKVQHNGTDRVKLSNSNTNIMIQEEKMGNKSAISCLTIFPTTPSDAANYVCVAENVVDADERISNLLIHVPPVIEKTYTPVSVKLPLSATLVCLVSGFPIPTVSWQKNGKTIDNTVEQQDRIDIYYFIQEGNITTKMNDFNSSLDKAGNRSMEYLIGTTNISVEDIHTLCEVGIVSVLYFQEVTREDTANYTCTAVSDLPETARIVNVSVPLSLVVLELPPSPTMLTITSITSYSVVVSWQIDTSTIPITGYMVHVMTLTVEDVIFSNENVPGRSLMLTLVNLQPNTDYKFSINSVNTAGTSEQMLIQFRTITNVAIFQLRLKLSSIGQSCSDWVAVDHATINDATDDVASAIVASVEESCLCGFERNNITSDGFRCFSGSTDVVTYRGEIHSTDTFDVSELIRHIEDWTLPGVSILVQRVFIEVDSTCRVAIESLNEEECIHRSTVVTTDASFKTNATTLATEWEAAKSPQTAPSIIGGVTAANVIVFLTIVIIMVILVLQRHKASCRALEKNKNIRYNVSGYSNTNATVIPLQYASQEGSKDYEMVSHVYETLNHCNEGYATITDSPDTERQPVIGPSAYNIATCEAYGTNDNVNMDNDYEMCPDYDYINHCATAHVAISTQKQKGT